MRRKIWIRKTMMRMSSWMRRRKMMMSKKRWMRKKANKKSGNQLKSKSNNSKTSANAHKCFKKCPIRPPSTTPSS
jgi:hypothetical protein